MSKDIKEIILIKNGEIALKGGNRSTFEELLCRNIKRRLKKLGTFEIWRSQSTITVTPTDEFCDLDDVCEAISKIFGIAQFSRAAVCEKDFDKIKQTAVVYLKDILENVKTFKVESKRSDKAFPMKSPEISCELGGFILENFPNLTVDVHNPDIVITVEVRQFSAFIHHQNIPGAGGMPVSSGGRAGLLISGGIDSPVAAYMMAKRGLELTGIHFFSPPYTSERAKQKVLTLLEKLTPYCGRIKTIIVPFTQIQEQIREKCDEEYFTLIMRRFMMRIAQILAKEDRCDALVTGESLGQVASQTIMALACTDNVCNMPVFRPVIGMDKEEIIKISRKIGTFETSIEPYEDCCTVFTPRHPRTKPKLEFVVEQENRLDVENLIDECVKNIETIIIG